MTSMMQLVPAIWEGSPKPSSPPKQHWLPHSSSLKAAHCCTALTIVIAKVLPSQDCTPLCLAKDPYTAAMMDWGSSLSVKGKYYRPEQMNSIYLT